MFKNCYLVKETPAAIPFNFFIHVVFVCIVPALDQQVAIWTFILEEDHVVWQNLSLFQQQRPLVTIDGKTVDDPATITTTQTTQNNSKYLSVAVQKFKAAANCCYSDPSSCCQ